MAQFDIEYLVKAGHKSWRSEGPGRMVLPVVTSGERGNNVECPLRDQNFCNQGYMQRFTISLEFTCANSTSRDKMTRLSRNNNTLHTY